MESIDSILNAYRIALKFRGSNFRESPFLKISFANSRSQTHATPTLTYGRGYFSSVPRTSLAVMCIFEVEAMVRGYHAYQDSWDALIGEELVCAREPDNLRDPFVVAVVKSRLTVGHVPLKICSLLFFYGVEAQ